MSRVYDALQQMEKDNRQPGEPLPPATVGLLTSSVRQGPELEGIKSLQVRPSTGSRLVTLTDPKSLGAEKFRALVTRLENLRCQKEIKSLQVTSSVVNEGKSMVAANLAITLAKHTRSKVLLLEGDWHRPSLNGMFGLSYLKGVGDWWSEQSADIPQFVARLNDMSLWYLSAGDPQEQPSNILRSTRFTEAFNRLVGWFDWIVVDSTPMLPIADANLWSRLVDGTLLVVREGVASVKALQNGLGSLDSLKLIGTVLNEASEYDRTGYASNYYGVEHHTNQKEKHKSKAKP